MAKLVMAEVIDNSDEVIEAMREQAITALMSIGQMAEGFAKDECPVGSPESTGIPGYIGGTLRGSISNEVVEDEMAMYVGTNVEYAPYVEFKDMEHMVGRAHFLRDSIAEHQDLYLEILQTALQNG